MLDFDELTDHCQQAGKWSFFLCSVPLKVVSPFLPSFFPFALLIHFLGFIQILLSLLSPKKSEGAMLILERKFPVVWRARPMLSLSFNDREGTSIGG